MLPAATALALALLFRADTAPPAPSLPVLEIGSAKGVPGRIVRGSLPVGEESDGTVVAMPIAIATGRKPGPVVWVEASAHGDEYGGPRALQLLLRNLDPEAMSGAVVAVMITNVPAFRGLQRVNPNLDDLQDFGDAFPGRERFATERIALAVSSQVKRVANYFIDLHTGGDRFRQLPFVLYAITEGVPASRYDDLARGFGVPTLWRDTTRVFASDATTIFSAAGIPSFLLEVGGGQPLEASDLTLQADAIRSFLRKVGVLPGEPARVAAYTIITGYRIVTNSRGGFIETTVNPGDRVREGATLGRILDAYGDTVETLTAPAGAEIVLGVNTYPAAPTGGWLFELGTGLSKVAPASGASPEATPR